MKLKASLKQMEQNEKDLWNIIFFLEKTGAPSLDGP
jgi:hypothetical protein